MRTRYLIALLCCTLPMLARADDGIKCKADGNQQQMNACALDDYRKADKTLNDRYQALMGTLPAPRQQTLRKEQRAWVKQRDPQCKAATKANEGGSIWPLEYYGCLQAATAKRTRALEKWQR
ncbi:hypothetical protein IGB42_02957 [Andreprevotia sp. IGB-42]|uniref:lysozyme inhibitor LprI family protein n=1 Tax=Andreprevotia sp. IGB-42 TaxID=2497473 RepID=UPI00135838F4|nr:lysozyme inhibitor LprI family protein [Andreprevotia sp. IGB-42]KAF0812665.1 hypothetical protein IGB42_02957 [Andreprevotia sp. IGB-42]